jgi:hypothetical protein
LLLISGTCGVKPGRGATGPDVGRPRRQTPVYSWSSDASTSRCRCATHRPRPRCSRPGWAERMPRSGAVLARAGGSRGCRGELSRARTSGRKPAPIRFHRATVARSGSRRPGGSAPHARSDGWRVGDLLRSFSSEEHARTGRDEARSLVRARQRNAAGRQHGDRRSERNAR